MMGLPGDEISLMIGSVVLSQLTSVTESQIDG